MREDNRRAVMREFEQKLRQVQEEAARAHAEGERLRAERSELEKRRDLLGVSDRHNWNSSMQLLVLVPSPLSNNLILRSRRRQALIDPSLRHRSMRARFVT